VLAKHDRKRFEVFVYHNHPREDSLTGLARQHADHFHKVSGLNDAELLKQIRGDQIDILVDLNGLTGNHRLAVLSQRAAPVQLNWIGYPNTTGLTTVDYRLTDGLVDPPGQSEEFCTETLLRLHSPFLAYMPPAELPELKQAPRLSNGYITFGSFNALPKLNPALLRSWAAILQQVPESRLLIKNFGMDFKRPKEQVRAIFADQGIGPERLLFVGKTNTQQAHLQFYSQVDICLDTFPYNGTTTSCETLLMGVPLVSWAGHEHRSRVGLTLLSALGLESLVARNENELISVARFLADDANQLQTFRSQLRNNLLNSRLTDAAELTRDLEAKLATIHGACKQQGTT
jgi:predicted O-linked N-acetylglucosamine transferase (SPINDLY family)